MYSDGKAGCLAADLYLSSLECKFPNKLIKKNELGLVHKSEV